MNTWLETFIEQSDLNKYPVALRTRGGIGYRLPSGAIVSNFVGRPVHYFEGGLWKPITLQPQSNGDFEGSDFAWRGKQVFYKGKTLFEPRAVFLDGVRHNLFLRQDGNRIVADLPFGQYEIIFSERGVKELLTIPQPIEGLLKFDIPHANKPRGLYKKDRHIIGGITAESFQLTKNMTYPLVIDPDYAANTADGYIGGTSTTYSTARNTSDSHQSGNNILAVYNNLDAGFYYIYRAMLKFDTSGIPDTDIVLSVVMKCTPVTIGTTAFDVQIVKNNWSSQDPISSGNRETSYDNALSSSLEDDIWKNTSGLSVNTQYSSGNLSTSWVSLTGYTYYSMTSKNDRDNTAPSNNQQYIHLASQDHATSGYRPVLTVTHAAGGSSRKNKLTMLGVG